MKRAFIVLLLMLSYQGIAGSSLRLPAFFSDHMVLQRDQEVTLWGWSNPGESITVTVDEDSFQGTANPQGEWAVNLGVWPAGGPHQIRVTGSSEIIFNDVLFGEVWFCAGQSNMDWALSGDLNAEPELPRANYPRIRLFKTPMQFDRQPRNEVSGSWLVCTPATAAQFSAVAYYFGRNLHQNLEVPVGLIQASWGGSDITTWMSPESFQGLPEYRNDLLRQQHANYLEQRRREFHKEYLKPWFDTFEEQSSPAFEDHNLRISTIPADRWTDTYVPRLWERTALGNSPGLVWYKMNFETQLDYLQDDQTLVHLGRIDDHDLVYLNGVRIGYASWKELDRQYVLPDSLLKENTNELVVAVINYGGAGGFHAETNELFIESVRAGERHWVPLSHEWQYYRDPFVPEIMPVWLGAIDEPTLLYNAMVAPLTRYPVRGVIWYQGEHSKSHPEGYGSLFKRLIIGWRKQWSVGDFPFLFVQLPNYANEPGQYPAGNWARLRQQQAAALELPRTGMAVTYDVGNSYDIHPRHKEPVGQRLALLARKIAYQQDVVASGPRLQEAVVEGGQIRMTFDPVDEALVISDLYGYPKGFEVGSEENGEMVYAAVGGRVWGNEVVVRLDTGMVPRIIRYAWTDNPDGNLYNETGLPAPPFEYWFK